MGESREGRESAGKGPGLANTGRIRFANKGCEEAFREVSERYLNLIKGSIQGILVHRDFKLLFANQALADIFGYSSPEEVLALGSVLCLLAPSEHRRITECKDARLKGEPAPIRYECRGIKKEGTPIWIDCLISVILWEGETAVQSTIFDITERKLAEERIRESEERYRKLMEAANDAILVADAETGLIIDCNEKAADLFGVPVTGIIGMHQAELHPPEEAERYRRAFLDGVEMGRHVLRDAIICRRDGRRVWVDISGNVFDAGGRRLIQGIFRDVSERKEAEESLRRAKEEMERRVEDRTKELTKANLLLKREIEKCRRAREEVGRTKEYFEDLIGSAGDAIIGLNRDGAISVWNTGAERIYGFTKEETIGKTLEELHIVESAPELEENRARVNRGETVAYEGLRRRKDGSTFTASITLSPVFGRDGRVIGRSGIHKDITYRKEAEEKLRRSKEFVETVLNSIKDGISIIDTKNYRIVDVNNAFLETLKLKREEVIGKTCHEVTHHLGQPCCFESFLCPLDETVRTGRVASAEHVHRDKKGDTFYTEVSTWPIFNDKGEAYQVVHVSRDITERKRAEEEILKNNRHMAALYSIDRASSQTLSLNELLEKILDATMETLEIEAGGVLLMEEDGETLTLRTHKGISSEFYRDVRRVKVGEGVSGRAAREKRPLVINAEELPPDRVAPHTIREGFRTIASTPLLSAGSVVGVLTLGTRRPRAFPPEDLKLLSAIGQQLGMAVQNSLLYEEIQGSLEKLEDVLKGTITAMALTVETRDPYTAGHQKRVTDLACAIAKEMGLSGDQIEGIRMAGLIHDIGKISIPAEILSKPGHLSGMEFGIIKTHPEVGSDILKGIEFPWPIATIVLQHHEKWDGSGYPSGLKGEGIRIEARILAVADVVEAMASHRPYRPALGIDAALHEILKNRGILYDPDVADACVRLFKEKGFRLEEMEGNGRTHRSAPTKDIVI